MITKFYKKREPKIEPVYIETLWEANFQFETKWGKIESGKDCNLQPSLICRLIVIALLDYLWGWYWRFGGRETTLQSPPTSSPLLDCLVRREHVAWSPPRLRCRRTLRCTADDLKKTATTTPTANPFQLVLARMIRSNQIPAIVSASNLIQIQSLFI